jgi:Tfp pilus assembly protein PilN
VPGRINLLPKTERVRTATNVPALLMLAGGVVVVFILALTYFLVSSDRSSLQDELVLLQDKRAKLEAQMAALDEYKKLATQASTMAEVVRGAYAGRTSVAKLLSDFSRAIPANVWLTTMTIGAGDPQSASGEGAATGGKLVSAVGSFSIQGNTYSFPDVALLLVRLRLVPSLSDVTLNNAGNPVGAVDSTKEIRGFSLAADVVNPQPADTPLPMSKVEVEGL